MFEKEAEEYAEKTETKDWEGFDITREVRKQAFLAGLKAGRPQWHDLQKDPNDLPKESKKYYVYSEECGVEVRKFIADAGCFECRNNIIVAWKEIVLPKESE